MIARTWSGETTPASADGYLRHLQQDVLPRIRGIEGHLGSQVLRRSTSAGVEFLVITLWESMEAIREFAGSDPELAVVADEARALLSRFDTRVRHFQVVDWTHST